VCHIPSSNVLLVEGAGGAVVVAGGREVVAKGVRAGPAADGGVVGAREGGSGVDSGDDNDVACEPIAVDPVAAVDVVVG
jgi:hypothetical protein